jgi:hypothetical protein
MMARAPEWRSLSLAVQHVAKIKGTEAAAKIELERALAEGLKTRASRISAGLGSMRATYRGSICATGCQRAYGRTITNQASIVTAPCSSQ